MRKSPVPSPLNPATSKRERILSGAVDEFSIHGFSATRMEDIAKRAGVAKGTVYLHFKNKEALFEGVMQHAMLPIIHRTIQQLNPSESRLPIRTIVESALIQLLQEATASDVAPLIRLLVSEALRFPALGELYRQGIIQPVLTRLHVLLDCAHRRHELRSPGIRKYPQLLIAPVLITILWAGFHGLPAISISSLVHAHMDTLFQPVHRSKKRILK